MSPIGRTAIICLSTIALSAGGSPAAQLPMDLDSAVRAADIIVEASVASTSARWVSDARGRHIYTYATIRTMSYVKGTGPVEISVEFPGGTVGDITECVSDTVSVAADERAVLLLTSAGGTLRPAAGAYGKYSVENGLARGAAGTWKVDDLLAAIRTAAQPPQAKPGTGGPEPAGAAQTRPASKVRPPAPRANLDLPAPAADPAGPIAAEALTPIMTETFEGSFPGTGWALYGAPTWGATTYRAHAGARSIWCGASQLDPSGGYTDNMSSWAVYGPFSLAGATDANVTLWLDVDSELGFDYLGWYASLDDQNYYGYRTSGSTGGWASRTFDLKTVPTLGNLCGQGQVYIALVFESESSLSGPGYKGAFIDDVQISKQTGGGPVPAIASISPGSASAGTDTPVTIAGTNFGAATGSINFFYRSGQPTIPGAVVSWADTQVVCKVPIGTVAGYAGSAGSGPVTVTAGGGTSNPYTFLVTFAYGQRKWPVNTVSYRVNENCTSRGTVLAGVQAAAASWTTSGALFALQYAGTTTVTAATSDSTNEVVWGTLSSSSIIGQATYWFSGSTMVEADIVFNNGDFTWSTTGSPTGMDVQTIAAHELGHWLNLRDLYGDVGDGMNDAGKVMYGYGSLGLLKRSLTAADRDGIAWIYGANHAPTVDAGSDVAAVYETWTVSLGATGNDPDSDPLAYAWQQTAGKTVTLNGAAAAAAWYTAPTVATVSQAQQAFRVSASDNHGASGSDSVNVRVYMLGDVLRDDTVDVFDLLDMIAAFGAHRGDPKFNPWCDFNADSAIDVLDLLDMIANFGRSLTP